jgi:hypothetical protein
MSTPIMFEQVRQFFRVMQAQGYQIEIRSFDQITGTRGREAVGFTIRGMCTLENQQQEKQPLMIDDGQPRITNQDSE